MLWKSGIKKCFYYQFLDRSFTVLLQDTDVPCYIGHYKCVCQYKRMTASTSQLLFAVRHAR